jgi:membrane protease YdiL (CAAX protease family)
MRAPTDAQWTSQTPSRSHCDEIGVIEAPEHAKPRCWSWPRFARYTILLVVVYFASQVIGVMVAMIVSIVRQGGSIHDRPTLDINTVLGPAIVASAVICIPLVRYLVGRCELRPWAFLGMRRCPARYIVVSGIGMIALLMAMDAVSTAIGRPIVSPFMEDAYASAASPLLLFLAFVIAAPLCEELLFRGFLFGGLRACGTGVWVAVAVVSLVFASIHTQYDWYDGTAVLLIGLVLVAVRVHSGSLIPSIFMHGLTNTIAFTQAALLS